MSWIKTNIGDCIDFFNGYAFKSNLFTSNINDYPLIKGENVGKGEILWDISKYWDKSNADKLDKFFLEANDIVLAMDRPYVQGSLKYAMIKADDPKSLLVQRVGRLRAKTEIIYPFFLKHIIASPEFRDYIKNIMGGVGVPHISPTQIQNYSFNLPPIPTQRKIASILSAYDDLIENNLKRIKLLEEAAQNIYKEWFVNFRFPGWENAKFNKETGLPEGWKQSTIFGEVEINSGGTPKTTNPSFWNGDIPFFTPTDASKNSHFYVNQTEKTINEDGLKKCNSKLYPFNTVFITARGTVGNLCLAMIPMAMNQSCYALIGKNSLSQLFIFFSVNDSISQIKKTASGGVFDTIIVDTFKRIPFIIPEYTLILKFENQVTAILNQTQNLIIQNQKLKEARDILLPRLMNQTINV